jgi:hypothetical protein
VLQAIEFDCNRRNHTPHYSGTRFRTQLQRPVHFLEATSSIAVHHLREKWQQQTFESLSLDESDMPLTERFDRERMLAVEDSRHPEMTKPSKFPVWLDNQDGGTEKRSATTGRLDVDLKAGTDTDVALHMPDKGIPLGVSGEIRQHSPDFFVGDIYLNLGVNLFHVLTTALTLTVMAFARRRSDSRSCEGM